MTILMALTMVMAGVRFVRCAGRSNSTKSPVDIVKKPAMRPSLSAIRSATKLPCPETFSGWAVIAAPSASPSARASLGTMASVLAATVANRWFVARRG